MARTLPTYAVQVAWTKTQTGVFTIGASTIDGADALGGAFGNFSYTAVTAEVKECRIDRGRDGAQGAMRAGTCALVLKDTTGTYNPDNPASPLAGSLLPLRPLRVRATHNAVTYGLFTGFVTRIEHDPHPSVQETRIEAVDFLEWLVHTKPVVSSGGFGGAAGGLILFVLDRVGFTDSAFMALDAGHLLGPLEADGSQTALGLIEHIAEVEQGVFFVAGDGTLTFQGASTRDEARAVDATWTGATVGGARPAVDVARLVNGQEVVRLLPDGEARRFFAADGASRDPWWGYGVRDGAPISSALFADDLHAETLANYIVYLRKDPGVPTSGVRVHNTDDARIVQQLARDLGDRVAFSEAHGGTSTTGTIEGIRHRIWEGGRFHETDYTLSKRRFDAFTIGTSTIDGAHVIGF